MPGISEEERARRDALIADAQRTGRFMKDVAGEHDIRDMQDSTGPSLLGICGRKGSGKSTAAQVLLDAGWKRVKFADPLKNMLRVIGLDDRHIEGDLKEVPCDLLGGKTPRWAMQSLGTEWGRKCIYDDFWMSLARREIALVLAQGYSVVVDDVRFDNEADMIRELGGSVLLIKRGPDAPIEHESEKGVTPDFIYENDLTREHLAGYMHWVFLDTDF